ncbi:MAG TPA: helix-turn-helix transcriptional regulator [Porphyromonadaceae bacterium]|nr:helix-turn-helix transcriptional regulator [Porphyromonadaceae bacterium]
MTERFKVAANHIQSVNEDDYFRIDPYLLVLDAFSRISYQSIYVIDCYKMNFLYVSENKFFLCGHTPERVKSMGFDFYLSCVPQGELQLLYEINRAGFAFCHTMPVSERTHYTLSYEIHLLHGKEKILVHHEISPLALSKEGNIWLAVCLVSLSSFSEAGHLEVRKRGSPDVWKYYPESRKWRKTQDVQLTERERSVLALSARGYTIKDISERLCITEVTVKFHRNKLFEKLDVNNITEAFLMAVNYRKL